MGAQVLSSTITACRNDLRDHCFSVLSLGCTLESWGALETSPKESYWGPLHQNFWGGARHSWVVLTCNWESRQGRRGGVMLPLQTVCRCNVTDTWPHAVAGGGG